MGAATDFFTEVFGQASGRMVLVLPNYSGKPVNDVWFTWPEDATKIEQTVIENSNRDVWFSPLLYASDSRTKDNSTSVQVLAADADSCDPSLFRERPSFVVETSPARFHVYWRLNEVAEPTEAAKINRRIAHVHAPDGCDTAFVNAAKLLRVPETANSKHPGARVILADIDDHVYSVSHFEELYPVAEVPDAMEFSSENLPEGMLEFVTNIDNKNSLYRGLPNSLTLRGLLNDQWAADKRSHMRYKLLCDLYRLGLPDDAVMALAWWAPSNKYRTEDNRGVKGLWDEAVKAKNEVRREQDDFDRPVGWEGGDTELKPMQAPKANTDFLTPEERESLVVNFVDEWVQWAGTKTDAPAEYHRATAVTLLSTVYSEFGHAFPAFGELKLNIWVMVLGRSTKDRKSTARGYLDKAFRALRTDEFNYALGDDVTPGGVSLALHDRAHQASVFSRDEVQGLFKELLSQSYMAGGLEVFTKLYDGWSGGRIRASGEKKILESVPVSFLMFLMGILSESADVLTVTNFRSGFLTRFVYVIGSRPEGYEAPPLQQGSREGGKEDAVFNGLMNHLAANRAWWDNRPGVDRAEGLTHEFMAEDDAWERYLEYSKAADKAAENSPYAEIIGTTTERMNITVLKLATIFAMDDRSLIIKKRHVLAAIAFAGEWFDNAVTLASMVSESEWQRDVDNLEKFIVGKGGSVSYSSAYRAFKDKRAFEFEEMVIALERRGTLNRVPNGNKFVLEMEYHE
jgi:hypothetical protein